MTLNAERKDCYVCTPARRGAPAQVLWISSVWVRDGFSVFKREQAGLK